MTVFSDLGIPTAGTQISAETFGQVVRQDLYHLFERQTIVVTVGGTSTLSLGAVVTLISATPLTVVPASPTTPGPLGACLSGAAVGDQCQVQFGGMAWLNLEGTQVIAPGDYLKLDTTAGQVVKATDLSDSAIAVALAPQTLTVGGQVWALLLSIGASSGGSGGGGSTGWQINGAPVSPTRPTVNLVAGTNMTLGAVDDSGLGRTNVTFASSGGSSGGGGGANGYVYTPPTVGQGWTTWNEQAGTPVMTVSLNSQGLSVGHSINGNADAASDTWRGATIPVPSWPPANGDTWYWVLRLPDFSFTPENGPFVGVGWTNDTIGAALWLRYNATASSQQGLWYAQGLWVSALSGSGLSPLPSNTGRGCPAPEPIVIRTRWTTGAGMLFSVSNSGGENWLDVCASDFAGSGGGPSFTPTKFGVMCRSTSSVAGFVTNLRHFSTTAPPVWA